MKIETYILARNEERIMPYLCRHYCQFSKLIILESNSTDKTVDIAKHNGAEIWQYESPDEVDDRLFLQIKEDCWQGSKADWVIVGDADEFVYHPDIMGQLEKSHATVLHPRFFNMFSESFPVTDGQIYDEVQYGTDGDIWLSKMNVFRPGEIKRMNWIAGCHHATPIGNVLIDNSTEIITLHMRFLSRQFLIDHYAEAVKRLSQINREQGWGIHFNWTPGEINKYFDEMKPKLKKII